MRARRRSPCLCISDAEENHPLVQQPDPLCCCVAGALVVYCWRRLPHATHGAWKVTGSTLGGDYGGVLQQWLGVTRASEPSVPLRSQAFVLF